MIVEIEFPTNALSMLYTVMVCAATDGLVWRPAANAPGSVNVTGI